MIEKDFLVYPLVNDHIAMAGISPHFFNRKYIDSIRVHVPAIATLVYQSVTSLRFNNTLEPG